MQLVFFAFFLIVSIVFNIRLRRMPTTSAHTYNSIWRKHLWALYISSALIMVRSVVRCVAYIQGFKGYINAHEVYLYVFDAVLMFGVMVIFNIYHPSEVQAMLRGVEELIL